VYSDESLMPERSLSPPGDVEVGAGNPIELVGVAGTGRSTDRLGVHRSGVRDESDNSVDDVGVGFAAGGQHGNLRALGKAKCGQNAHERKTDLPGGCSDGRLRCRFCSVGDLLQTSLALRARRKTDARLSSSRHTHFRR
jgi:hypothetical protein